MGRSRRPISYSKAFNDLAYLFWLNGPRIASQGLTGIKFCGLSRIIRPSCLFCVFAYSRSHSLTFAAHYGLNGPRIASQGLTGIKFCGLSRIIRPSCLFCVFAYSRSHSLTFAAHYGIMIMTTQVWPWQMWHCAVGTTPRAKIM